MTRPTAVTIVFSMLTGAAGAAQAPPPGDVAFEVASIRQNLSGRTSGGGRPRRGGGYTYTNLSALQLIGIAYNLPFDRILGGPAWMASDRYDVDATGKENATMEERSVMVRSLLTVTPSDSTHSVAGRRMSA